MTRQMIVVGAALMALGTAVAEISDARRDACERRAAELVRQLKPLERVGQVMMDAPAVPRLGIAKYHWWNEALHGVGRAGRATVFPQAIGLAATFDEELLRRVGDVISTEARAKYNLCTAKGWRGIYRGLTFWSPNINMDRDPRWGRGQETYGEDPFLTGLIGSAFVRGIQGDDPKYLKAAACAKHFLVHSGPDGLRHGFSANVTVRDLAEFYLPAFKTLVTEAKVEAVMSTYNAVNGVPCCANRPMVTDLLRGEWGFRGHVVSDVGAIGDMCKGHHYVKDLLSAAKTAVATGVDLCSAGTYEVLKQAVKKGRFDTDLLLAPLTHLFTTRMLLGHFDPPGSTPWDSLGEKDVATPASLAVAREAAEKSLVLVKNNGALPLDFGACSVIGVLGPRAHDEMSLLGNYNGCTDSPVTLLSGLVAEAGPSMRLRTGPEIPGIEGDAIVVGLGMTAEDEGEEGCVQGRKDGDRTSYALPPDQINLLKFCRRRTKKLVAVIFGGSPVDLGEVCKLADAVLLAWYPGEQGGAAIARAICGKVNPSGRLPVTFPKSYADLPDFADYSPAGHTYRYATKEPAYPFGYGLSYTTFAYADPKAVRDGDEVEVSVQVRNTGKVAGEEVVQLYLRAPEGAGDRRLHHLEGVRRVRLAPGEAKVVTLRLGKAAFAVYDEQGRASVPSGETTVFVGGGQPGFAAGVSTKVAW